MLGAKSRGRDGDAERPVGGGAGESNRMRLACAEPVELVGPRVSRRACREGPAPHGARAPVSFHLDRFGVRGLLGVGARLVLSACFVVALPRPFLRAVPNQTTRQTSRAVVRATCPRTRRAPAHVSPASCWILPASRERYETAAAQMFRCLIVFFFFCEGFVGVFFSLEGCSRSKCWAIDPCLCRDVNFQVKLASRRQW